MIVVKQESTKAFKKGGEARRLLAIDKSKSLHPRYVGCPLYQIKDSKPLALLLVA